MNYESADLAIAKQLLEECRHKFDTLRHALLRLPIYVEDRGSYGCESSVYDPDHALADDPMAAFAKHERAELRAYVGAGALSKVLREFGLSDVPEWADYYTEEGEPER